MIRKNNNLLNVSSKYHFKIETSKMFLQYRVFHWFLHEIDGTIL